MLWIGSKTLPHRWFFKGSNYSPLQYCQLVRYRKTVYVERGYKSKVSYGYSITFLYGRYCYDKQDIIAALSADTAAVSATSERSWFS